MSAHETEIICQSMSFEARCSCGWAQGASTRAAAEALAIGHRGYSPDAKVIIIADTACEGSEITDHQLRELFARHCECRDLDGVDVSRAADNHAAIHDCDTEILHDIQVALGIVRFDDIGRVQAMREARARCAEHLRVDTEIAARRGEKR